MTLYNKAGLAAAALLIGLAGTQPLSADSFSHNGGGSFTDKGTLTNATGSGSVVLETLTLNSTSSLTAFTTSYGGGQNLDGSTSAAGGFQPNISLFSGGTALINESATAPPHAVSDPSTGLLGDAYFTASSLMPGTYYLTLTNFWNQPSINAAPGSFNPANADSYFSGPNSFSDAQFNTRNGTYALNIQISSSAPTVPEPATFWLMLPALAGAAFYVRKRRASAS